MSAEEPGASLRAHLPEHAALLGAFTRAQADAAHKATLIQAAARKGPRAIQAAVDTADKAAKRRDAYAKKLHALGVDLTA